MLRRRILVCLCLTLLVGCATYSSRVGEVRTEIATGDFDAALQTLEKNRGDKAMLLYFLEKGLVLHYADRWQESNEYFQLGENLAADLYTRSISEGALSLLTSDNTISYRADPFEMAMIPYYRTLNYIYLGQRDEALVEARKASLYLRQYTEIIREVMGESAGDQNPVQLLRHNAFLQYFSAMLYEWGGEVNDAFIAYRHAAQAYRDTEGLLAVQTPPWLGTDLERTGRHLGFYAELEQLRKAYPELLPGKDAAGEDAAGKDVAGEDAPGEAPGRPGGEIVLLFEFGYVDFKIQNEINIPILETDDYDDYSEWSYQLGLRTEPGWTVVPGVKIKYWLRVAMPEMIDEPPEVGAARVTAGINGAHAETVTVEDIASRARINFEAESGKILLKTIARALSKYVAKVEADKLDSSVGTLVNIFGAATETADTRSWLTLPYSIGMARLHLPAGTYDLQVELVGRHGQAVATQTIPGVTVAEGEWRFISRRVFD